MIPTELQESKTFWQYCEAINVSDYVIHVPNEGKRSITYAMKLKSMGLKKGAADFIIFIPSKQYHGLLIEMKRINVRKKSIESKSPSQIEFLKNMMSKGYAAAFCSGAKMACYALNDYMHNKDIGLYSFLLT